MKSINATYGYVITTTPGLIEEGEWRILASGVAKGEVLRSGRGDDVAVYPTRELAEAAMMDLIPAGSTACGYAGLSVSPATRWMLSDAQVVDARLRNAK